MNIVGFSVIGEGEADKHLDKCLSSLERLSDDVLCVLNSDDEKVRDLVEEYGFDYYFDKREWGKYQHKIKTKLYNTLGEYNPDWILGLDADEHFDEKVDKQDLIDLAQKGGISWRFYIVNLYDDGYTENWSFWDTRFGKYDKNLNNYNSRLHPGVLPNDPYDRHANFAPYLIIHHGLESEDLRREKAQRYEEYDPNADYMAKRYYDFLKKDLKPQELNLKELRKVVRNFAEETKFKETYKNEMPNKRIYYVRRLKDDKMVPIPEKHLEQTLDRKNPDGSPKFELISEKPVNESGNKVKTTTTDDTLEDRENEDTEPTEKPKSDHICSVCGFEAKNKAGLSAHQRKHD